ncbi:hypothetical protein AX16_001036 [Volvariella volvacea WC 439]|nr:hypothetical protein AX16_001036 [Volvariella volvacea WC 439]
MALGSHCPGYSKLTVLLQVSFFTFFFAIVPRAESLRPRRVSTRIHYVRQIETTGGDIDDGPFGDGGSLVHVAPINWTNSSPYPGLPEPPPFPPTVSPNATFTPIHGAPTNSSSPDSSPTPTSSASLIVITPMATDWSNATSSSSYIATPSVGTYSSWDELTGATSTAIIVDALPASTPPYAPPPAPSPPNDLDAGLMSNKRAVAGVFVTLALAVIALSGAVVYLLFRRKRARRGGYAPDEKEHLRPARPLSVISSTSRATSGSASGSSLTGAPETNSFRSSAYAPSQYGEVVLHQDAMTGRASASSAAFSLLSPIAPAATRNSYAGAYANGGVYHSQDRTYHLPRSSAYARPKVVSYIDIKEPPLVLDDDPFRRIPTPVAGRPASSISP